jgi:hypothetical protein
VNGSYDYPAGVALFQKRAFSRSGDWFAFSGDSSLYVANTKSSVPYVVRQDGPLALPPDDPNLSRIALVFSPDEHFLVQHRSSQLSLHRLDAVDAPAFVLNGVNGGLASPSDCERRFSKDPANFCGTATASENFSWSADSLFVAYRTLEGKLLVADLRELTAASPASQTIETLIADGSCNGCQFEFQPSPFDP